MRGAGQPRGPDAQAEDEAAEEHGLRAVALEERLARLEHLQALAVEATGPFEQPAPALAPDQVADVVADDRGERGERDHELDFELAPGGEHGGGDQRRLAWNRHAAGLGHHEQEQQRVAGDFDEVGDVDEGREHWEEA